VREAAAEVEPASGTVIQVFTSGSMVQVFQMAKTISAETWNGSKPVNNVTQPEVIL
jgi:hypothetical protein